MSSTDRNEPAALGSGMAWCWGVLLAGLGIVAAAGLAFPLFRLRSPVSFNFSEGWNGAWALAAQAGRPLYAAPPELTVTNYPGIM